MMSSYLAQEKIADLRREADTERLARVTTSKTERRQIPRLWATRLRNRFAVV